MVITTTTTMMDPHHDDSLLSMIASQPALLLGNNNNNKSNSNSDNNENGNGGGDDCPNDVSHVVVHPLVLLHVLDHHSRRAETTGRVIGTLLGRRDGKTVEVTNCFAVPHAEVGEEVAIGKDFNKQMLALHLRANRKETIVGWYASAASSSSSVASSPSEDEEDDDDDELLIANTSPLIHDFYAGETEDGDPIHLVVDTRLLTDTIAARAYRSKPVILQGEPLANLFHEIRLTMESTEPESICLHQMVMDDRKVNGTDAERAVATADQTKPLLASMEKLYHLLDRTSAYVDAVVDGRLPPDAEAGRRVADTLATVPRVRPEIFDRLFNDSLQDLLMVEYLSNITRTQLAVAEKLNATLGV